MVWARWKGFSGVQVNMTSNDLAALVSMPVKKFFE
jgi:hypothetical protein